MASRPIVTLTAWGLGPGLTQGKYDTWARYAGPRVGGFTRIDCRVRYFPEGPPEGPWTVEHATRWQKKALLDQLKHLLACFHSEWRIWEAEGWPGVLRPPGWENAPPVWTLTGQDEWFAKAGVPPVSDDDRETA